MAVVIADAVVRLLLDQSEFNAGIDQAKARLNELGQQAQAVAQQAQAAAQQAQGAASQAQAAANQAASAGGGGFMASAGRAAQSVGQEVTSGAGFFGETFLPRTTESIRAATDPNSPSGRGFSFGEDIGATGSFLRDWAGSIGNAARGLARSFTGGFSKGVDDTKGVMSASMRDAIDEAIKAGQDEAEIGSPSRRAARELGSPITEGVGMGILAGTGAMTNAMMTSLMFAFGAWKAGIGGGTFVGSGLNQVANPGGMLGGGIGGFLGGIGNAIDWENKIGGEPQSPAMASRMLMGQLPMGVRDFGQSLVSGLMGSFLPGWAAGPLSDMVGTMIGTKPILTPQQAMAGAQSADQGGFTDYPYGGGQYVFNNTYNLPGNFTDVEREVQAGTLQAMRRLGVW